MNEAYRETLKAVELKMIRHAMVSVENLEEIKGKYNLHAVENRQTLSKIEECFAEHDTCTLELMKLMGFNSPSTEHDLYPNEINNFDMNKGISDSIIKRDGIISLFRNTANKLETDFKPIDVHLEAITGDIEYLTRTHTPKPIIDMTALSKSTAVDVEWINKEWIPIPKRAVTLITAKGGMGKSYFTLQAMLRFLSGNEDKKAFGWFSEDPIGVTKLRAENICAMCDIDKAVMDRLVIVGSNQNVHHLYNSDGLTGAFMQVKRLLKDYDLVALDPLIGFYGEDENNNSHARAFMNGLNAWVNKEDKAVIVIHHSSKNDEGQGARGAGAFADASRLSYSLSRKIDKKEASDDNLFVTIFKDNYGAKYHLKHEQYRIFPASELSISSNSEGKKEVEKWQ